MTCSIQKKKEYEIEARFVDRKIRESGVAGTTLLELGCGTGKHALELAKLGWDVQGIDLSEAMVNQAIARASKAPKPLSQKLSFQTGDIRNVRVGRQFDSVISLFHVMSYQVTNDDLQLAIQTAATHLKPNGLFLFDFWYGPAVLSDPPTVRVKRMGDQELEVTRLEEPSLAPNTNQVTVKYNIFLKDLKSQEISEISEDHSMRYLFLPELKLALDKTGFDLQASGAWGADAPLDLGSWYGYVVARLR